MESSAIFEVPKCPHPCKDENIGNDSIPTMDPKISRQPQQQENTILLRNESQIESSTLDHAPKNESPKIAQSGSAPLASTKTSSTKRLPSILKVKIPTAGIEHISSSATKLGQTITTNVKENSAKVNIKGVLKYSSVNLNSLSLKRSKRLKNQSRQRHILLNHVGFVHTHDLQPDPTPITLSNEIFTYSEAMRHPQRVKFIEVMEKEVKNHVNRKYWEMRSRLSVQDEKIL